MEHLSYDIRSGDFTSAGAASRDLKRHLKRIGAESDAVRRAMIAAYEAEMNVVIHAHRGRLEARFDDQRIDVDVIDEGPGIPEEFHARIFEKFGQVAVKQAGVAHSTGLGLTFCKLAVEAHGGQVGVISPPGAGATLWLTLPARPATTARQA